MSWQQIKKLKEERAAIQAEMRAILDKVETEKRSDPNRVITAEENAKFDELSAKDTAKDEERKRYEKLGDFERQSKEELEQRRQQPGRDDLDTPEKRAEAEKLEKRKAMDYFLRHGYDSTETRALTVSGVGGVVGDRPFYDQLVLGMKAFAGVRQAGCTVIPSSDGNSVTIPVLDDSSNIGQIVGEGVTDNTSADPATGFISLAGFKHDSKWIKLSVELIQDSAFPVETTVLTMASERIGRIFNRYTTTGTGTGQPKGFVTSATTGKTAAATGAVTYDEIIDFIHSLDAAYRGTGKAIVQLHDNTLAAWRKLKDGNGRYIWSPGEAGAPNNILGFPYVVNNDMAQLTAGANSVVAAFGDFSRYFVKDVTAPLIVRADELFIGDGQIGFRVYSRHDGALADLNAVKLLKTAAS